MQEENRDMVFTRVIQKHYPSHLNAQKQKATRETNLELKRMEKDAARMNYGRRLTQRQQACLDE